MHNEYTFLGLITSILIGQAKLKKVAEEKDDRSINVPRQ
jgi:hypothetical protein